MENKKLKIGVIGCGFVASAWHIPGFMRIEKKASVQALCDISPQLVASAAKEFNVKKTYSNVSEMLKKEELDIVDICTPPHTHAALAVEAMEAGCNVLIEKPMALKLSEGDEMVRVSKKTGKQVCVVHNELFRPPMIEARKLVKEGKIGKVLGMEWVRFTHKDEYLTKQNHWIHKLPGGLIGEVGPHAVYASLAFLKTIKDVEITAKNILKYPWAPFDYFNIIFEGEEITSSVIISMASNNFIADVNVFGTDATLRLDLQKMSLIQQKLNTTKPYALAVSSFKSADQIVSNVMSNAAKMAFTKAAKGRVIGHATEIEQYVDSIINNQRPPVTAEEGREVIRVMEMLVQKLNQKYPPTSKQPQ
ncbi:MAG: Gfo/Idh/MocA family oxidoreductase [Candidatus Bathyarchaeia archaeon]